MGEQGGEGEDREERIKEKKGRGYPIQDKKEIGEGDQGYDQIVNWVGRRGG